MYIDHPAFETPEDTRIVWRYMDLPTLLHLLQSSTLWFAAPSTFNDPWDGMWPNKHRDPDTYAGLDLTEIPAQGESKQVIIDSLLDLSRDNHLRDMWGVSCWHMSDYDSAALWEKYQNYSVAIQTTVSNIKNALAADEESEVYIGSVLYDDENQLFLPMDYALRALSWKRMGFEHEKEVRLITHVDANSGAWTVRSSPAAKGKYVKVYKDLLINELVLSPMSPDWLVDVVVQLASSYKLKANVMRSTLLEPPV